MALMNYDAIVVGAGHNGLACAVHLATRGWKVLVLEQAAVAGGAVKTAEITRPGFRHDMYAMNVGSFAGSAFHAEHGGLLARHGLGFVPASKPFASVFADGSPRWIAVEQGLEATISHIRRASERDAQAWRDMSKRFDREGPHLLAMLGTPMPSWALAKAGWRMWRELGTTGMADTGRLLLGSSRAWLGSRFESDAVRTLLATWGMHLDLAPDVAGGALFPYLEAMLDQRHGMALGKGGADVIVRAMVSAVQSAGGEVRTSAKVARIHVVDGRARSVELATGERFEARRAVVANVHPKALYGTLLREAAPGDSATARALRPGPATMMVHLALDALPRWRAGAELQSFAYVHLARSIDHLAQVYGQAMAGQLPAEPVLVVGQPTVFDPSRAPPGQHVLWVQVRVLPAVVRGDFAGSLAPAPWDELKEAYADRVMDLLEAHAPGLRASVLGRCVLSPADLERDNPNLVGGDNLAGSHQLDQFFVFRPAVGRSHWRTGVSQLFHVGASTWPGAGTGAGSGYMLGRELAS